MAANKFSFEANERNEIYTQELDANYQELRRRLKIADVPLNADETELIKSFCSNNIRNISYYNHRIEKENKKRWWYSLGTVSLLVIIPLSIFLITEFSPSNVLRSMETTSGWITTVLAIVLGLHKFVSEWLDARKFRSIFHQAKVDLQNVLYALIEDNASRAIAKGYDQHPGHTLGLELVQALKDGIRRSREIVDTETKAYFDLSASPSFDLSGTLTSASTSAKEIFSGFKSKRFKEELMATEASENRAEWRTAQKELVKKTAEIKVMDRRLQRLEIERKKLCELIERSTNAEQIEKYRAEFDLIDDEIEELYNQKYLLESDRDYSNFVMEAYDEDN